MAHTEIELFNEKGEHASLDEVVQWWLNHYEGFEHWTEGGSTSPETWYTVTAILKRCLTKIKDRKL